MKEKMKKRIRPALVIAGGAIVGLVYYHLVGCSTSSRVITSNPVNSMAYMGLVGWLLSRSYGEGCTGGCNM